LKRINPSSSATVFVDTFNLDRVEVMQKALITGVTGQDGYHLSKLLISKKYEVFGLVNGQRRELSEALNEEIPDVKQVFGDLTDYSSISSIINEVRPSEIYNLGGISFVGLSFTQPQLTADVTALGILRILEACKNSGISDGVRIYQASSSEMFGKVLESPQTEKTPFYPRSPYAVSKVFAHYMAINYREAYGMHVSNGILFNHEGEKRGTEFVTRKITQGVAKIKLGVARELRLGSLDPRRDWGYAGDYVEAMWKMLQMEIPDDYVIATGESHSVKEFVALAFEKVGLSGLEEEFVVQDKKFLRPTEVDHLIGDYSKAKDKLGWRPKTTFDELVGRMVKNDLILEARKMGIPVPETPVTP
jgi:GDPmannose 4,6-dehydratase